MHMLETYTGRLVDPQNPEASSIHISDIARALSTLPRFNGHTQLQNQKHLVQKNDIYNVAEHSLFVSSLVEFMYANTEYMYNEFPNNHKILHAISVIPDIKQLAIKALLHDAHEAYIGDMPSPIKHIPQIYDIIKNIEYKLDLAIFKRFNLTYYTPEEYAIIKFADDITQKLEANTFLISQGKEWDLPEISSDFINKFNIICRDPYDSYCRFLEKCAL